MPVGLKGVIVRFPIILGFLLVLACGKDSKPTATVSEEPGYVPQSSWSNALSNLKQAYTDRKLAQYQKLFAEEFSFHFSPMDVNGSGQAVPDHWLRPAELQSADSLFRAGSVRSILLSYAVQDSAAGDGDMAGTTKISLSVSLLIDMTLPGGEPFAFAVPSGFEVFYLRPYPQEQASDGRVLWKIVRWDELTSPSRPAGSERMTWGMIKFTFSRP